LDEQVEGRGNNEILLRWRDRRVALPHAAELVVRIARRSVEQHTACGAPVGAEPAVEVVANHRAGSRVDEPDVARVIPGLAPVVAVAGADRYGEGTSVRRPLDALDDLIERRTRRVDALGRPTERR